MEVAYTLGYTITLIEDGTCNFLYYDTKARLNGTQLFKDYVDLLYPIKKEHKDITYSKHILNILGGALGEKKIYREVYTNLEEDEEIILEEHEHIDDNKLLGNNKIKYGTINNDDAFVSGYARTLPFITAWGRKMLSNIITENQNIHIIRVHTDSILCSAPLTKTPVPNKKEAGLGELGYEGYYPHCVVKNMAKPIGNFIPSA